MEYWEFLIQREGDRKWRSIKTGNLQLTEGKYRIVANSNLFDTSIQTRVTHQTLGSTVPQPRARSCKQTTNCKGLLAIIPFTQLHPGIWQFVCSVTTAGQSRWHQAVKLRVVPHTPTPSPAPLPLPIAALPDLDVTATAPTPLPLPTTAPLDLDTATAPAPLPLPIAALPDLDVTATAPAPLPLPTTAPLDLDVTATAPAPLPLPTTAPLDLDVTATAPAPLKQSESDIDYSQRRFVKRNKTKHVPISAPELTLEEEDDWSATIEEPIIGSISMPIEEEDDWGAMIETISSISMPIDREDDWGATIEEPISSISMQSEQESWADGLDRLLEQLEQDSLQGQTRQPTIRETLPGVIQLHEIVETPSQLIILNRSTFSEMIPGNQLTIIGTCNLQRLSANLIQTAKAEKLSICLRHPQTSEIIASIERSLPPNLDTFSFNGQLELLTEPKTSLLLGEVNLYDKHHIQLGSSGFSVTLNLTPQPESELSLLELFDRHKDNTFATLDRLTQELELEAATIAAPGAFPHTAKSTARSTTIPPIDPHNNSSHPAISLADQQGFSIDRHPDIHPVNPTSRDRLPRPDVAKAKTDRSTPLQPQQPNPTQPPTLDPTDDLEIDFAPSVSKGSSLEYRQSATRNYPNLEIVVDD
jgi:hypothetical protein